MKELTFQQIEDIINKVLLKNGCKEALSISIEAHIVTNDILKPRFSAAVYQKEKTSSGASIFHYVISEGIEHLKYQLQNSVIEKQKI